MEKTQEINSFEVNLSVLTEGTTYKYTYTLDGFYYGISSPDAFGSNYLLT